MCVTISISNDGVVEETESFAVTLVSEDPAVVVMLPFSSVTINDSSGKYFFFLAFMKQRASVMISFVDT